MIKYLSIYITPVALAVSFFVETSSWWIRVAATKDNFGYYISRSNIYLYGGRFFALIFGVLLSVQVESRTKPADIAFLICICFFFSCLLQTMMLNKNIRFVLINKLCHMLRLPLLEKCFDTPTIIDTMQRRNLFIGTLISSSLFSLGVSIPLFIASVFIENRLVVSNLGQLINAFGMIIILFFVDQKLYEAFDSGNLYSNLVVYSLARSLSFLLICLLFGAIYIVMSYG